MFPSLNDAISDLRIPATTTWNVQMVPTAVLMAAEGSVWTVVNLQEHKVTWINIRLACVAGAEEGGKEGQLFALHLLFTPATQSNMRSD